MVLLLKWGILKGAAGLHQTPAVASTSSTLLLLCLPARDGEARNILYFNAACTNADQPGRVLAFVHAGHLATLAFYRRLHHATRTPESPGLAEAGFWQARHAGSRAGEEAVDEARACRDPAGAARACGDSPAWRAQEPLV